MPGLDGIRTTAKLRESCNVPIILLTAKSTEYDKVLGLELGADDYMVKPFDAKEVVARIKAVLRRCQTTSAAAESTEGVIEFDNLRLDMNSYELRVKGKVVEAIYNGAPIVTTSVGSEGIPGVEDVLLVEDQPEAFADTVVKTYSDTEKLRELAEKTQSYIRDHFSIDAAWEVIREDFE